MFPLLGKIVVRTWPIILLAWIGAVVAGKTLAPRWEDVTTGGEVQFLPDDAGSRRADKLFESAFEFSYSAGNIALVFAREGGPLTEKDYDFIKDFVRPGLNAIQATQADIFKNYKDLYGDDADKKYPINRIMTREDGNAGVLLDSPDKKATVVVVEVKSAFQDARNVPLTKQIERMIRDLRQKGKVPEGLDIGIAGSATAGRDLDLAEAEGAKAIERWTIAIVVILLVLLYRAPLVAIIPLLTVFVAVEVAVSVLGWLAKENIFAPSRDLRVFVTVLAYGAGVDYCLFLIARYREELDRGIPRPEALEHTIGRVGGAITASAAVVIGGIGMMAFARFGKIHEAGLVIPLALTVALVGTLTFAASLLRLAGPWAFWPQRIHPPGSPRPKPSRWSWLVDASEIPNVWDKIGPILVRRAGLVFIGANLLLLPFVVLGVIHAHDQNYNPLSDLPVTAPSRVGMGILTKHFPVGVLGPVTVLVKNDNVDFSDEKCDPAIAKLTERLLAEMKKLDLTDVRTLTEPLGISPQAKAKWAKVDRKDPDLARQIRDEALTYYVGGNADAKQYGHVMRIEITLDDDPLKLSSIKKVDSLREDLPKLLPEEFRGSILEFAGPTASLQDLSVIKQADQERIQILVSAIVLLMLLIVLRRLVISIYLVVSVLLSYVATLGLTDLVFRLIIGPEFPGLDWKVPIFLFTILVAVGEDYNIFLLTRVKEEQDDFGPMDAIPHALSRTGQVITSCGIVMAGTFASLFSGSLLAMKQLGFAMAVGVLLDTLLVRPILVPTFLVLLQRIVPGRIGQFMALGRWKPKN